MTTPHLSLFASAVILGYLALPWCAGCRSSSSSDTPSQRDADLSVEPRLVTAVNDLGVRLLKDLARRDPGANVFVSPASVELALAMTYNGAGGSTRTAMAKALGLDKMTLGEANRANADLLALLKGIDPEVEIDIANSLWGRQGVAFDDGFIQRSTASYGAEVRPVDFADQASADTINSWVRDKTKGKIAQLVDHMAIQDAVLVLVNALYFKGAWSAPFDKHATLDGPFTPLDGKPVTLPMMRQSGKFQYVETKDLQAISLPYGAKRMTAYVLLPKPDVKLADFIAGLTADSLKKLTAQMTAQHGMIVLPRFKSDYSTSLKASLGALGMGSAFTAGADFSGMVKPESLTALGGTPLLSDVVHKTALEVNEEGTEAAAATGVVVGVAAMPPERPFRMTVDRPFVLILQDSRTGAILFLGSIVRPK